MFSDRVRLAPRVDGASSTNTVILIRPRHKALGYFLSNGRCLPWARRCLASLLLTICFHDNMLSSMTAEINDAIQGLVLRIFRLDDALKAAANRISEPAGQTGARWQVLNALDDGPKTVAEIARLKNGTRQGVQRIVNELVADGATTTNENPKHRRYPLICLTSQGRAALETIRSERERWTTAVSAALGHEVDPAVLRFLDRFRAAVETTLSNR